MNVNFKIYLNNRITTFSEAKRQNLIEITENGIEFSDTLTVYSSTELLDRNGKEIYENDILISDSGNKYLVLKIKGTFFIKEIDGHHGCITAVLSDLKIRNKIDNLAKIF